MVVVAVVVVLLLPLPPPHPRSLASYDVDANDDPRAVVVEDVTRSRRYWEDGIPLSLLYYILKYVKWREGPRQQKNVMQIHSLKATFLQHEQNA